LSASVVSRTPGTSCDDEKCPFHGSLRVRGKVIEGIVSSGKMQRTVVVSSPYLYYDQKYRRYQKRTSKYHAHNPPCISAKAGDKVKIAECRPLSKTVSFVVIEKLERE